MVRGIGLFVHTCIDFYTNYPTNFIIDARWYWNILLYPRGMRYNGDFDGREKVFAKMTMLQVIPSEPFILE